MALEVNDLVRLDGIPPVCLTCMYVCGEVEEMKKRLWKLTL